MAMVLPALRLCLLLLNLYGTFKAIKPSPMAQRSTRNGQGPSGRAIQLRKREMKSRLAVWVVWAIFSILEQPLDRTIGFITPFYNEFKCTILLFLIVSRSYGAEAIFLHLIHPLVRPYVHPVDNILATLQSIFDLVTLILLLPVEYVFHWWHQWSWTSFWSSNIDSTSNEKCSPDSHGNDQEEDRRRRLRPRNDSHKVRMRDADRKARAIFLEIEDAQAQVRTRARGQLSQPLARNNAPTQPVRETRTTHPHGVGLRPRKRVLDYSNGLPKQGKQIPGSRLTGVHHLDPTTITQLARDPAPHQIPFSRTPIPQPLPSPSPPIRIPTPSSSSQSSHEIWYPPQSAFGAHERKSPSPDASRRTPSPIYPPVPSAYQFTPRSSYPPPPRPRSITPPDVVTPTLRRVSTGDISRQAVDAYDGIDQFPGRVHQAGPSTIIQSVEPLLPSRPHEDGDAGDQEFFRQALDPSIRVMDVDMETLSTRDGSSANEESMEDEDETRPVFLSKVDAPARHMEGTHGSSRDPFSRITTSERKVIARTGPVRRSARTRSDRSPSVETDVFGFTIHQDSIDLKSSTVDSSSVSSFRSGSLSTGQPKKPLARTKPALKSTQEEGSQSDSSVEISVKKKRKLRPGMEGQPRASARNRPRISSFDDAEPKENDTRKEATVRGQMHQGNSPKGTFKDQRVGTRATRVSARQPLSAQIRANAIKRGRGK